MSPLLLPGTAFGSFNAYFQVATGPGDGDYTLSWDQPPGQVALQERVDGGSWTEIGRTPGLQSPMSFAGRNYGTYEYRLVWTHLVCTGGGRRSDCNLVTEYSSVETHVHVLQT